jgi:hypothetical protein
MFTSGQKAQWKCFLALYVDDLLVFSKDLQALKIVKEKLYVTFEMKDLGKVSYYLGIQILRDRRLKTISLD